MARTKAAAAYWCTPGKIATERRKSTRLEEKRKNAKKENDVPNTANTQPFVNPQSACPIYNLPQEIRDAIFELALTSYEDKSRPHNPKSTDYRHYHDYFKSRPGFFHHHRTDTVLLRTCRLIHGETRLMPVAINSHVLYYNPSHVLSFPLNAANYFRNMTDEQLAAVQHIHIFAENKCLTSKDPGTYLSHTAFAELGYLRDGSGLGRLKACPRYWKGLFPKRFTITVRHTDWRITRFDLRLHPEPRPYWYLENIMRNEHWENVFGGLKVLRMEFEVEEGKEHLIPLVKRFREYVFDIGKGEVLVAEEHVQESTWEGLVKREVSMGPEWNNATFYVVAIVWKVRKMPL